MEPGHPDEPPAQVEVPEAAEKEEAGGGSATYCQRPVAEEGEGERAEAEGADPAGRAEEGEGPRPVSPRLPERALARYPRGGFRLHSGSRDASQSHDGSRPAPLRRQLVLSPGGAAAATSAMTAALSPLRAIPRVITFFVCTIFIFLFPFSFELFFFGGISDGIIISGQWGSIVANCS